MRNEPTKPIPETAARGTEAALWEPPPLPSLPPKPRSDRTTPLLAREPTFKPPLARHLVPIKAVIWAVRQPPASPIGPIIPENRRLARLDAPFRPHYRSRANHSEV